MDAQSEVNTAPNPAQSRAADLLSLKMALNECAGHPFVPGIATVALQATFRLLAGLADDVQKLGDRCSDCGSLQGAIFGDVDGHAGG